MSRRFRSFLFRTVWIVTALAGSALAQENLTGEWLLTNTVQDVPFSSRLVLKAEGEKLQGELGRSGLEGTISGSAVRFTAKPRQGNSTEFVGKLANGALSGTTVSIT